MRPTTSTMLQQNNNNNYPCLDLSGSTRDMIQKCSRASLPFPNRLELGLADLPLIRGLRAWALFSKNRRKAGGLPGGGQALTAPPVGRGGSASCPRPGDVYLSGEWSRMGHGLPLGLDARQTGIGALVTVATLKTSEGGGKTQTQCLFLRTEKGSCLYSTAKPSPGVVNGAASGGVGGWLRGKTGGGDFPAGRRDNGPTSPAHTGVNRVRVRSGRRWRKSGNAAVREKRGASRERQQRQISVEERQEGRDKGGLATKPFPSLQQDSRRARQERDGPPCCHNASPKTCGQCGRGAQSRGSQEESPRGGASDRPNCEVKGMRKEAMKNKDEEEEEEGGLCGSEVLVVLNPGDFHPESHSGCDVDEIREAESEEELKTQTCCSKDAHSETEEVMKTHTGNTGFLHGHSGQVTGDLMSSSDHGPVDRESEVELHVEEEESSISHTAESSVVSTCPASISAAASPESSAPAEGTNPPAEHETRGVQREQETSREEHLHCMSEENNAVNENKNRNASSSRLGHGDPSMFETERRTQTGNGYNYSTTELKIEKEESQEEWVNPEDGEEAGEITFKQLDKEEHDRNIQGDPEDTWRSDQSEDGCRGQKADVGQTSIGHVGPNGETEPTTSHSLSLDNPTGSLPPLGSMATGLPCLEEEEEGVGVPAGDADRDQEGKRGSTVATEEERKEEEEEDGFGVFMQAEGEPAWSEGFTMSASVPCGSGGRVALGNHAITGESTLWTPGWTDSSFRPSGDAWTAFPQDSPDEGRDVMGQWWPTGAVEERGGRLSANHNLIALFAKVFPSTPGSSDPCDMDTVPTLTQLLRARASQDQDQGLLDGFHDLNKMICQRNKRADGVSRDLLLTTLHLEPPPLAILSSPNMVTSFPGCKNTKMATTKMPNSRLQNRSPQTNRKADLQPGQPITVSPPAFLQPISTLRTLSLSDGCPMMTTET